MRVGLITLLLCSGCAEGSGRPPGSDSGTTDATSDTSTDGPMLDAPMLDAPMLDAPMLDAPMLDAPMLDAPMLDAPTDASVPDVPGMDTSIPDTGVDAGSVACTPATAAAVCGGRPCVDGWCCNSACTGACESCGVSGLEGTCTTVTGFACDDGNPCTHSETCMSGGVCGGGTTVSCDGMDTFCRDFTCNGTATCTSAARNVGMTCDDGNAATTGDVCLASGTCMGTMGGCSLPGDACANGTQTRDRCSGARVIGRSSAGGGGYVTTASTCTGSNRFDDCSWDAGNDHAYRIWLRPGEQISVSVNKRNTCFSGYAATLKLYLPSDCTSVTCGSDIWCHDFVSNGELFTHTASTTGWHVVVVDGSTAFDDEGEYTLTVTLTGCATAGCEC